MEEPKHNGSGNESRRHDDPNHPLVMANVIYPATGKLERSRREFWERANSRRNIAMRPYMRERFFEIYATKIIGELSGVVFEQESYYDQIATAISRKYTSKESLRNTVEALKAHHDRGYFNFRQGIEHIIIQHLAKEKEPELILGYMVHGVVQLYDDTTINPQSGYDAGYDMGRNQKIVLARLIMHDGRRYAGYMNLRQLVTGSLFVSSEHGMGVYSDVITISAKEIEKIVLLSKKSDIQHDPMI